MKKSIFLKRYFPIKELKDSLTQDTEQIKQKLEALKTIVNEVTTELYKNASPPPGEQQSGEQQSGEQQSGEQQSYANEQQSEEQKADSDSEQKSENKSN